jgi:hypothetical protein
MIYFVSFNVASSKFSDAGSIINLSHIYSWLGSWITIISEWFDEVATNVFLTNL